MEVLFIAGSSLIKTDHDIPLKSSDLDQAGAIGWTVLCLFIKLLLDG